MTAPEPLKRLIIIVKPFKVEDVVSALLPFSPRELSVSECRGYGRQKGHLELYEGSEYTITFLPKVKLELVALAYQVEGIIQAVVAAARTGRIGDGKVFVLDVRATDEALA